MEKFLAMKKLRFQLVILAALAAPSSAVEAAAPPSAVICPAAESLQAQLMGVASHCVATTVGLVRRARIGPAEQIGSGSGVVISADGLIMTAGHVIEAPGTDLTVRFPDGRVVKGIAVGLDHATDTGLVRITDPAPEGGWPFSAVAPDESANVGDWVLATGNPGSIIVDRDPPIRIGRVTVHNSRSIDTNCALEPGDSGGPLFDLQGRVVGINSRIATTSGPTTTPREFLSAHVPVSLFSSEMKDLLAGANAHPDSVAGQTYRRGGRFARGPAGNRVALLQDAIKKLLSEKDPEMMKLMADAQGDGGRLQMTPELMDHLIDKAGLSSRPSTRPGAAPPLASAGAATRPAVAAMPATRPIAVASAAPATQPATQPAAAGIAADQRPALLAQVKLALLAQFPAANLTDAVLNRIMDHSTFIDGKLNLVTDGRDLRDLGVTVQPARGSARSSNRAAARAGKMSLETLSLVTPSLAVAGDCVVEIRDGEKSTLLGTIVSEDGYIVTKASELPPHPTALLSDGRALDARFIGRDTRTDLALLKVAAHGLKPVEFAGAALLGQWVTAPTDDPSEPAIGVVSDVARPIPARFSHFAGQQHLLLGLGFAGPETVVATITPGMPAEAAGMTLGDTIFELDGKPVKTSEEVTTAVRSHKSGDTLDIRVHRDTSDVELKAVLGPARDTNALSKGIGEADSLAGGELSKRRTNFPMAIQTDTAVWADQIGGPLIDLQGKTIGVTIARYDRVCTFALPADVVQKTVSQLKAAPATQP
jgi:serine protease Do